jgi:hypothetical protein
MPRSRRRYHDTREPPWPCVACGYVMDAAGLAFDNEHDERAPEEGDYSVCINCGTCYVRHGPSWCRITAAELAEMPHENRWQITLLQTAIGQAPFGDLRKRGRG